MNKTIAACGLLISQLLYANSIPSDWKNPKKDEASLVIDPTQYLNRKQKKLIYSGFPAYSAMSLIVIGSSKEHVIKTISCAIEYDLWDEKFQLLFSSEESDFSIKNTQDYYDHCLILALNDSPQIRTLLNGQSKLKLRVSFLRFQGKPIHRLPAGWFNNSRQF